MTMTFDENAACSLCGVTVPLRSSEGRDFFRQTHRCGVHAPLGAEWVTQLFRLDEDSEGEAVRKFRSALTDHRPVVGVRVELREPGWTLTDYGRDRKYQGQPLLFIGVALDACPCPHHPQQNA